MSSNDGPGKPVTGHGSGTLEPDANAIRLLLSVPHLGSPKIDSIPAPDAVEPKSDASPSELSDNASDEISPHESSPAEDVKKTFVLAEMFTGNARTLGTLGTIAAAIFACTLVGRAMKQDHSVAGSISELAFRDPPASQEFEPEAAEPDGIFEATPNFDPEILTSNEDRQVEPIEGATPWQRSSVETGAPSPFEQDSAQPTALAAGDATTPRIPKGITPDSVGYTSDAQLSMQHSQSNPPRGDLAVDEPRYRNDSIVQQSGYQPNFHQPSNQDTTAPSNAPLAGNAELDNLWRSQGQASPPAAHQVPQAVAVAPADVWQQFERERDSERELRGGHQSTVRDPAAAQSPPPTWPGQQRLAAKGQFRPDYPSTSTTAYPSFEDLNTSLHQQRIQRDQQFRVGDRRALNGQNGLGTSVPSVSSGEFR